MTMAVFLIGTARPASAQALGNIFSGTNSPGATSVSSSPAVVAIGTNNSATIGPGFATSVGLIAGVADTLTASLNPSAVTTNPPGAPGALTISETSAVGFGVLDVGGHFSVDKIFTGVNLTTSTPYQFTLTKSQTTLLGVLTDLTVQFKLGGTTLNSYNLLTLLTTSGGNTATINFTTPANLSPAGPFEIVIGGDTTANLIGNDLVFTSATFNPVPEPKAWLFFIGGLALLISKNRLGRTIRSRAVLD